MMSDYTFPELILVIEAYNDMHTPDDEKDEYVSAEVW